MIEIIKVMLQEGIDEETIHEVLDVIEENYEIVGESLFPQASPPEAIYNKGALRAKYTPNKASQVDREELKQAEKTFPDVDDDKEAHSMVKHYTKQGKKLEKELAKAKKGYEAAKDTYYKQHPEGMASSTSYAKNYFNAKDKYHKTMQAQEKNAANLKIAKKAKAMTGAVLRPNQELVSKYKSNVTGTPEISSIEPSKLLRHTRKELNK